jgi:hypothetical protein
MKKSPKVRITPLALEMRANVTDCGARRRCLAVTPPWIFAALRYQRRVTLTF